MCSKAGVSGRKTNHSLRATTSTRLYRAGVPEQLIMERTGHRSTTGLSRYTHTNAELMTAIGEVLDGTNNNPTTKASPQKAEAKNVSPQKTKTKRVNSDSDNVQRQIVIQNCVVNLNLK